MSKRWRAFAATAVVVLSAGLGLLSIAPASAATPTAVTAASASLFATPSAVAQLASAPLLVTPAPTSKPVSEQEGGVKNSMFNLQSMEPSTVLMLLVSLVLLLGAIVIVVRAGSTHRAR
ncbi:hypothetical protein [Glaciihabitans sp. dw_435]|uniref:hypothetical protein n=1 Tax=Glaciihabitans sp. dw_435 TaxID=2720081 RepID=UPI001BD2372B|nr:hypothetical protein [Glaciihabitans sp. dw_435]